MRLAPSLVSSPTSWSTRSIVISSSISVVILTLALSRLGQLASHFFLSRQPRLSLFVSSSAEDMVLYPSYAHELRIAQLAVQRAAVLTRRVFHEKAKGAVDKSDKSPVTIGDFGAQALIIAALQHNFPDDAIVAEEEAAQLRQDAHLRATVWSLVQQTRLDDEAAEATLGGPVKDVDAMLDLIDRGNSAGGASGRVWTIDPIDGTKGFLRGGQYAVCLGLLVDGQVRLGVLGCPNLPVDDSARLTTDIGAAADQTQGNTNTIDDDDNDGSSSSRGVLFSAVEQKGADSRPLTSGALSPNSRHIGMRPVVGQDLAAATFCESVEAGHSSHRHQALIAQKLGITQPSVRMDSQAKYGSIARGAGDIYLRLPVSATYQEKIWDHAAGDLIVRESGGLVTDIFGRRLDFSVGRTLAHNKGVVAAPLGVHANVLAAVQEVLKLD
ncbi:3'(2'),5'-bisphosphate nucleotidase [Moelleriella libera RCEF 2490]|uniref:3'(2'),5'-bisphosphate nucleotidase n=1 Tax=Moelleriella libera RCEF 2490 TaxID=1081109 RepID=A0A167YJD3_9HYPO|nr:3'(2'),5'-bisphosphate nucleotidase [Moelleriella libera RCEF 2490]